MYYTGTSWRVSWKVNHFYNLFKWPGLLNTNFSVTVDVSGYSSFLYEYHLDIATILLTVVLNSNSR
jgi:hypothetical protein